MKKQLRKCARKGCTKRVSRASYKYCSHDCAQLGSRKPGTSVPDDSFTISGDTAELTKRTKEEVRTLADLIRVCKIDTNEWHITKHVCNKWNMGSEECYQVKAWMVRKVESKAIQAEIASLVADAKKQLHIVPKPFKRAAPTGNMLELSIYDVHVGKLGWKRETVDRNYDVRIAERDFDAALEALIARTSWTQFDRILFTLGNDLLNSDNDQNTTYGGTPQSTDGRFQKTFWIVRQMTTRAIERLRQIAPVYVPMVPGNHDKTTVWHLGDSLECWFHTYKDVFIDNAPTLRKYHEFGRNMIMLAHGDKGKLKDYPALMAAEQPEMWGRTLFKEAHTGHRHGYEMLEQHGVRVRTLPALCATDAWHSESTYVGNLQSAEAFVWNKDEGIIGGASYTVPKLRADEAA